MESVNRTQTMDATDRRCPQCGAELSYDATTKGLFCSYCEYREEVKTEVPDEENRAEEVDLFSEIPVSGYEWGTETKTVICESCGAETIYDSLQLSDVCPYCGGNHVMKASENVETLAPGGVVPFQIDVNTASRKFQKWIKGKLFCPRAAKQNAKPDHFQGVYLPYWTYDCNTTSQYRAKYGITRTRNVNGKSTTYTEWHNTAGVYSMFHNDVLVSASKRHDKNLLSTVEPFDTEQNKKYQPEYLAGYLAERYSVGLQEGFAAAKTKMDQAVRNGISEQIRNRFHASTVSIQELRTNFIKPSYKYLMLPLWMSSFEYKQKIYRFLVNGQTGKVGGKAPVSAIRVVIAVLIVLAILLLLFYGIEA